MLRSLVAFAATALLACSTFAAATIGQPAPSFSAVDVISGKPISNESLKGKTVVVEWNNFGCPFVKKFYGSNTMQTLQAKAVKDGVVWVSINSSAAGKEGHLKDAAEAKAALSEHKHAGSHYLLDHDGSIGHAFGAKTTPHMYVINKEGVLAYQGAIDDSPSTDGDPRLARNYVREAVNAVLAGNPAAVGNTKSYGCGVKY